MSASANAASAVPIGRYGMPRHPDELATHRCIRDANNPDPNRWPFLIDGEWVRIPIKGPLVSNSPPACCRHARVRASLSVPMSFLEMISPKAGWSSSRLIFPLGPSPSRPSNCPRPSTDRSSAHPSRSRKGISTRVEAWRAIEMGSRQGCIINNSCDNLQKKLG